MHPNSIGGAAFGGLNVTDHTLWGFPGCASGKESPCWCRRCKRHRFDPWVRKIPWRRKGQPTPVFLPGGTHGQRSLVACSPWGAQRVRHNWARIHTHIRTHTHMHTRVHTHTLLCEWKGVSTVYTHSSANSLQQNFLVEILWHLPDSFKTEPESLRALCVITQPKDGFAEISTSEHRLQDQGSDGHPSGVYLQRGDQGTFPALISIVWCLLPKDAWINTQWMKEWMNETVIMHLLVSS